MELRRTIIAIFSDVICGKIMGTLTPLETTIKQSHEWALQRIHSMCTKATDLKDVELVEDAESIRKEFKEWLDSGVKEHNIYSLEYIGEGSEY